MKKVVYLYISGTLQRKDSSLVLMQKNGNRFYIPIEQIDIIFCFSEISFNKRVLSLLDMYNVSVSFFNFYGTYIGHFSPNVSKNGKVLIQHVNAYQNMEIRLYIAKKMIEGQIKNSLAVLKYYQKKGRDLATNITAIKNFYEKMNVIKEIEELLILEVNILSFF